VLAWARRSQCETPAFQAALREVRSPGPGTPKHWAYPWVVTRAALAPGMLAIDLGCGAWSGLAACVHRRTGALAVGLDAEFVPDDSPGVRHVIGDVARVPFPDAFFDRVFSVSVLEHVPPESRAAAWSEIFRVLRPGGLAVLAIDWVFRLTPTLARQLATSEQLARLGSRIFGNHDFAALLRAASPVAAPVEPIDPAFLPGSPEFDEERLLADPDLLYREGTEITDAPGFTYTTVGLALRRR
jgi:SAM-dependent methyltransferase